MLLFLAAFVGGALTIASPCILPILTFVLALGDQPFRKHGLPLLVGMAVSFALVATLASVGGSWIVEVNEYGRRVALVLLAAFGLSLLLPGLAARASRPAVALGERLSAAAATDAAAPIWSPVVLGVSMGLLWTPCAGPILGVILTGAALNGASVSTLLLLLAYAVGACTSLAVAMLFGGRFMATLKRALPAGERLRKVAGAAVLLGVASIAFGADTGVLSRISYASTFALENWLAKHLPQPAMQPTFDAGAGDFEKGGFQRTAAQLPVRPSGVPFRVEGKLPGFDGALEWINSPALTAKSLKGKVVLVDFWTYSCINCLRTTPYLKAWAEKYKDAGLVVVGVHTPEYAFEKRSENVRRATRDLGIKYPVAVDSDFKVWRAFGNQYWPAFYFVDAQGRIRHHQFGEGQYELAERVLQQLLAEAGHDPGTPSLVSAVGEGTQAAPGPSSPQSDETYLGYQRADGFPSVGGVVPTPLATMTNQPRSG